MGVQIPLPPLLGIASDNLGPRNQGFFVPGVPGMASSKALKTSEFTVSRLFWQ